MEGSRCLPAQCSCSPRVNGTERDLLRKLAQDHAERTVRAVRARRKEVVAETKAEQGAIEAMMRGWLAAVEETLKAGERPNFAAVPTPEVSVGDPTLAQIERRRLAVKESQTS